MKQWELKSAYAEQEAQDLLNQYERDGWTLFYFWIHSESMNILFFFYKELEGDACKTLDTSSLTGPST